MCASRGRFDTTGIGEDLFPTDAVRWAYDALCEACSDRVADMEYLRILHHAAFTMETLVEAALRQLRGRRIVPRWETVLALAPGPRPELPVLAPLKVDLSEYDRLLAREEVSV